MANLKEIGKRIQNRRKLLGLTQEQLADEMNVSVQMVSNLERGNKAIRIDNLLRLCQLLNVSTDYILTGKENDSDISALAQQIAALPEKEKDMIRVLVEYCSTEK